MLPRARPYLPVAGVPDALVRRQQPRTRGSCSGGVAPAAVEGAGGVLRALQSDYCTAVLCERRTGTVVSIRARLDDPCSAGVTISINEGAQLGRLI